MLNYQRVAILEPVGMAGTEFFFDFWTVSVQAVAGVELVPQPTHLAAGQV